MASMVNLETLRRLAHEVGEDTLDSLLDVFTDELARYLAVLNDKAKMIEIGNISHSIKSSAASFGADELSELAGECEYRVKLGQDEWVLAQLPTLLITLEQTIRDYQSLAAQEICVDSMK